MFSEKISILAADDLLRKQGMDFSRLFPNPAAESLANDNIMARQCIVRFTVHNRYLGPWTVTR